MGFISQMREHPDRTWKMLALILCNLAGGLSIAIIGPTLLDLQTQTHTTLTHIVFAFNFKAVAGIIGALAMGAMYKRMNYQVVVIVTSWIMAVVFFAMGFLDSLSQVLFVFAFFGLCIGMQESGMQVYLLQLWGKEATPFMQFVTFTIGGGFLLAPLLATPFLVENEDSINASINGTAGNNGTILPSDQETMLVYPYSVIAVLQIVTAIVQTVVWMRYPITTEHPSRTPDSQTPSHEAANNRNGWKIVILVLQLTFVHLYIGLEIAFGSFLTTFAVESDQHMTKAAGSQLTSFFWSTFTFMKLVAIGVIPKIGDGNNILLGLAITGIGNAVLYPFGTTDQVGLWVGVGLISAGLSSLYACAIRYLESYFKVTDRIGVAIGIAFMSGEFTFPFIISLFLDSDPNFFPTLVLICSVALMILYPLVMIICKWKMAVPEPQDKKPVDYEPMD